MDKFKQIKQNAMKKLQEAKDKKEVDKDAVPLLDILNSKRNYFTSSSCYGRICLINIPTSKKDADFEAKWHRTVNFDEVKKKLDKSEGKIWFKMESFILHISCRDMESARKILNIKQKLGLKRGGIFNIQDKRIQIELEHSLKIDCPAKYSGFQISDDYLKLLLEIANEKYKRNIEKWERLKEEFEIL